MAILGIARMGRPILKQRAEEVIDFNNERLDGLIESMTETMANEGGIGLAAPQVFVPLRTVVFLIPEERNNGQSVAITAMINPSISPIGDEVSEGLESCLSVPGLAGIVPRWNKIRYTYQDHKGKEYERIAEGFHARVVQHECDHLDGILYPMRMSDLSTLAFTEVIQRLADEQAEHEPEGAGMVGQEGQTSNSGVIERTQSD